MVWQEFQPVQMGLLLPSSTAAAVWKGCAPAPSQPSHFPASPQSDGKYVSAHSIKVGKSVVQILPSK